MQSPPLHSTGTKCFTRIKNVPSEQKLKFVQSDQILSLERKNVLLEQNYSFKTNGKKNSTRTFWEGKKEKERKKLLVWKMHIIN